MTVWLEFCASAFAPPRAEAAPLADPCAKAEEQTKAITAKDNTSRFIELPPKGLEMTWLRPPRRKCKGLGFNVGSAGRSELRKPHTLKLVSRPMSQNHCA